MNVPTSPDAFKAQLRRELFWDTDFSSLDVERHARAIIERVAERGNRAEMRSVLTYYGAERVENAVLQSRKLSPQTVSFFSALFGKPVRAFRSHRTGVSGAIPV